MIWTLVLFDWFGLNLRMQVILDSLFARPGSAPIGGGKKGEFRDWTSDAFRPIARDRKYLMVYKLQYLTLVDLHLI